VPSDRSGIGRRGRWVAQRSFWRGAVETIRLVSRFYAAGGGRDMEEEVLTCRFISIYVWRLLTLEMTSPCSAV
jgi:hypothetical protein